MPSTDTTSLYQAFPHLRKIDELWGTQAGRDFINDLLSDSREGDRQGFAPEHATALFKLLIEHDNLFPQYNDSHRFGPGDEDNAAKDDKRLPEPREQPPGDG